MKPIQEEAAPGKARLDQFDGEHGKGPYQNGKAERLPAEQVVEQAEREPCP